MLSQHAEYSSLLANLPVIYFTVSVSTFGSAAACMPNRAHLVTLTGSFLCRYSVFRIYTTDNTTLFLNYSDAVDDLQASGDPV
jgi:hypothetical protein